MKFEKNNRYFNIAVYTFCTCMAIIIATCILLRLNMIFKIIKIVLGIIYTLLEPLIIGIIIAYLLDPIVNFYEYRWHKIASSNKFQRYKQPHLDEVKKKRWHTRTMPTLLTFLTVISIIGIFILIIIMNVEQISGNFTLSSLKESITYYIVYFEQMINNFTAFISQLGLLQERAGFIQGIYDAINRFVFSIYTHFINGLTDIGIHAMNWLLAFVVAFYLLQDKARCLALSDRVFIHLCGKHYNRIKSLTKDVDSVFTSYIRGQVIDSIIVAVLTSVALTLIRLDFAIIIGIISGIFNLIPYFGPVVGFVLSIIIGVLDPNPMKALYGAIAIFIIQQIDGWFIVPKIVGDCVKLHPVVVLLAILIGGNLFGLIGMLLAVPIAAFIRLLLVHYVPEIFGENK